MRATIYSMSFYLFGSSIFFLCVYPTARQLKIIRFAWILIAQFCCQFYVLHHLYNNKIIIVIASNTNIRRNGNWNGYFLFSCSLFWCTRYRWIFCYVFVFLIAKSLITKCCVLKVEFFRWKTFCVSNGFGANGYLY